MGEWLERSARKQGVAGSIPAGGTYFHFEFFAFPVVHSSARPIQMKSSMTFIQSNGCNEIDLILNKYGGCLYMMTCQLKLSCNTYFYMAY